MTELEKLDAGLEYDFWDEGVNARKLRAIEGCARLNALPVTEEDAREEAIRELFGRIGGSPTVLPTFSCDNGKNIRVGENFLANYNVTILDIAPVAIGDYVMIGPNTSIITVNHPLSLPLQEAPPHRAGQARHHRRRRVDRRRVHDSSRCDDRQQRGGGSRRRGHEGRPRQLRGRRRPGKGHSGDRGRHGGGAEVSGDSLAVAAPASSPRGSRGR